MATGPEMLRALKHATASMPPGATIVLNYHDADDLCRLSIAELRDEFGYDDRTATRIAADLEQGSVKQLGQSLSLDLRPAANVRTLIPGEGIRRAQALLKDDPQTLEEMLLELDQMRHPERYPA